MTNLIEKYFPDISSEQKSQFLCMPSLYKEWNEKINVISRKDIDHIEEKHILHSLAIAKVQAFLPGAKILDVGTGGGFPGIPLAILFPQTEFHLIDAIGKKIQVVQSIANEIGLSNVRAEHIRAEQLKNDYDFIVSRAVTTFDDFYKWVYRRISPHTRHSLPNGILYLKGGDLTQELESYAEKCRLYPIRNFFTEDFFETKQVLHYSKEN